jgi:hypothetical protein
MVSPSYFLGLFGMIMLLAGSVLSQERVRTGLADDWSAFFPEIEKCVRTVHPISIVGDVIEQTAEYEWPGRRDRTDPNYFGCGSITLRISPDALKSMQARNDMDFFPTSQRLLVHGYESIRHSPLCGNDPWAGSLEVYFDHDKVFAVSASVGAGEILQVAETADYRAMKIAMARFRRSRPRTNG